MDIIDVDVDFDYDKAILKYVNDNGDVMVYADTPTKVILFIKETL